MRVHTSLTAAALPVATPPATAAGGGVWTSTLQATQGFDHLSAFGNGVFYAQYLDSYAKSTDYGLTWVVQPRPPRQYEGSAGLRFASPSIGYSVNGDGVGLPDTLDPSAGTDELTRCGAQMPLQRTTDGGATWHAVCVPHAKPTDSAPHFSVEYSPLALGRDGRTVLLTGMESYWSRPSPSCAEAHDVVLTTHDSGAHWVRAALPAGWQGGYRSQVLDASTMALLSYYFDGDGPECESGTVGLFVSRDGGATFRKTYVCPPGPTCTSVAMLTRSRIILGRTDGSTLVRNDGGTTWRPGQRLFDTQWQPAIDSGQVDARMFWVQSLSFADAKHGFASTRGSGTWRTDDGGISWTQERSHECEYFVWGIGEIAAGSATTAITGGPHLISARTDTPAPEVGCLARPTQLPSAAAEVWHDGSTSLSANGFLRRR